MQQSFGAKTNIGKHDGQIQVMLFVLLVGANLGATNPKNRPPMVDKPLQSNTGSRSASPGRAADSTTAFECDILPIFRASCVSCHAGQNAAARLQLDFDAGVLRGGANGKAVVAGDSTNSLLMRRVIGQSDDPRMPQGGQPLTPQQIDTICEWIDKADFSSAALAAAEQRATLPPAAPQERRSAAKSVSDRGAPLPPASFAAEIRPIFAARCLKCHGPDVQQQDLRLDSLAGMLKGSINGPIVIPGNANNICIMRRLEGLDKPQMPYGGPALAPEQTALVRAWIERGAPGPESDQPLPRVAPIKHWAYMKPVRPVPPQVNNPARCRNPIDNFMLARLEKEGLHTSPEADKETLIRRVSLDLIGLLPAAEEVDAFLADTSPNAYEKVVDRLLASPHYGERWATPWLDLARYADTGGYAEDVPRVAWNYRDWVIRAHPPRSIFSTTS